MEKNIRTYFYTIYIVYLVLGILGILEGVLCFAGIPLLNSIVLIPGYNAMFFVTGICTIIISIFMIVGANKMKEAMDFDDTTLLNSHDALLGWAIFLGIVTLIPGVVTIIFACIMNDKILKLADGSTNNNNVQDATATPFNEKTNSNFDAQKEQLEKYKNLYDEGIITESEYEAKRKQILGL